MRLPETIRIQIADKVTRILTIVMLFSMILFILSVWLFGGHQYHRVIPAVIAMVAAVPGWLLARKGRPLIGIWFLYGCFILGILSGMILSGGVKAPAYTAVLFCVTPIVVLYGLRGGVIFASITFILGLLFYGLDVSGILRQVKEPPAAFQLAFINIFVCIQIGLTWVPVHLLFKALKDSQEQTRSLNRAVNERQAAEACLMETKRLLEQTQAISKLGGWEYDLATRRLTWTDEAYRIHGLDPADGPVDADNAIGFYSPDHQQLIAQAFRRAVEKERVTTWNWILFVKTAK